MCCRSGSRSSCLVGWTGWWGFGACFSAMLWPRPSRFGDAILVLFLHLIEASSCSVHSRQLLPVLGFVRLMVRSKLVAAHVLQASAPPSSFDLHSPRPRVAVSVRRRSSAVLPFGWWQPGSRLAGGKPLHGQLRWRLEASLDATEEAKTDACCCLECQKKKRLAMATAQLLLRRASFLYTPSLLPRRYPVHSSRLLPRAAMAADATSQFQKIQIQREDTTFDAYIVGKENAPGVVVLQEWWGVDYEVKNHAIHISQIGDGYRALIPDLYRGKVALEVAEAQHLMEGLDWQGAIKDIQASVKWLKENGSPKVGVTGYCMGGALAIASGVLVPEVDAVVAFYGTPSSELADPSKAQAPTQAHFGELDSFVGFADVTAAKSLEEKLKSSGIPHEVHIYPGCSHAFMNASPEALERRKGMGLTDENQGAIDLAWSRFTTWMDRFLGSA